MVTNVYTMHHDEAVGKQISNNIEGKLLVYYSMNLSVYCRIIYLQKLFARIFDIVKFQK